MVITRDGSSRAVYWTIPVKPNDSFSQRMLIVGFVAPFIIFALFTEYLFPRNQGQTLLVAGLLAYAAFISSGLLSPTLVALSSLSLHATVWLAAGIMIDLHWHLPVPLSQPIAVPTIVLTLALPC